MCWIGQARRGWLTRLIVPYTLAGIVGLPWILAGAALDHAFLLVVVVFAAALVAIWSNARERPSHLPLLVRPLRSESFPSGHAASWAAAACAPTMLAPDMTPLWIVMAFSRVYVGVHYPTDILAGIGLGLLVFSATLLSAATVS